jgi:hypothetical protein
MKHLLAIFAVPALVVGTALPAFAGPWRYIEPTIGSRPPVGSNTSEYRYDDGLYVVAIGNNTRYWDIPLSLGGQNAPGVTNYVRRVQVRARIWGHSSQERICVHAFVHNVNGQWYDQNTQCSSDADNNAIVWKTLDVDVPEGGTVHVVAELFSTTYTSWSGHWYSLAYNDPFMNN